MTVSPMATGSSSYSPTGAGTPGGFMILQALSVPCTLPAAGNAFLSYGGQYYMHDPRGSWLTAAISVGNVIPTAAVS